MIWLSTRLSIFISDENNKLLNFVLKDIVDIPENNIRCKKIKVNSDYEIWDYGGNYRVKELILKIDREFRTKQNEIVVVSYRLYIFRKNLLVPFNITIGNSKVEKRTNNLMLVLF